MKKDKKVKAIKYEEALRVIDHVIMGLCKKVYPNDEQTKRAAVRLTTVLDLAEESKEFVNDLLGFIDYCEKEKNLSSVLTTLFHDLGEFSINRREDWFCPRSSGYAKYAKRGQVK